MVIKKTSVAVFALTVVALAGCTRQDRRDQANDAARQAGQAAYKASHDAEKAAKELGQKLDEASHHAKEGWDDAKHQDQEKKAHERPQ